MCAVLARSRWRQETVLMVETGESCVAAVRLPAHRRRIWLAMGDLVGVLVGVLVGARRCGPREQTLDVLQMV